MWAVFLIFSLEFNISGVTVLRIHKNSKKWWLCEELLSENDFEAVLATLGSYDYAANAFEAVQMIDTKFVYLMIKMVSYVIVC